MKWIYRFFVVLGEIFFLLLIGLVYFIITDPFNLRPLLMSMYEAQSSAEVDDASWSAANSEVVQPVKNSPTPASGDTGVLNETQAKALESVGLSPQSIPAQFTPQQTACFVNILGQARVDAIVAGDTPTPTEFFQAKDCL